MAATSGVPPGQSVRSMKSVGTRAPAPIAQLECPPQLRSAPERGLGREWSQAGTTGGTKADRRERAARLADQRSDGLVPRQRRDGDGDALARGREFERADRHTVMRNRVERRHITTLVAG